MVDAIVSFTLKKLDNFLRENANFIQGIAHDVDWLKTTLDYMRCLLKDAEERQDEDHRLRKWLSDVADIAYDADDVIDDFFIKIEGGGTRTKGGPLINMIRRIWARKPIEFCYIGKNINKLKRRLDEIDQQRTMFRIRDRDEAREGPSHTNERLRQLRRTSSFPSYDDHIVGFEQDAESLKAKLLRRESRRCVISIFGMGGLGKTTLAQKLYNDSTIKDQFRCRGWVSAFKKCSTKDLLHRIMKSFMPPGNKEELEMLKLMNVDDLERKLCSYLERHRYLAVIDDVWEKDAWQSLKRAFPDNKKASRVIITTRNKAVAEAVAEGSNERTHVYELPLLTEEKSWKLFCKKAFRNGNVACDQATHRPSWEKSAKDMVRRCNGLPLAIDVLGGLMAEKHSDEWSMVKDRFWRDMLNDSIVKHVLDLSYNDLPCELKLCFLYLGLFPEDLKIDVEKVLHLWMAEGFIQPSQETLEELAAKYLSELIDRNLIQVADRNWRRNYSFRQHDLVVRDLAIEKAKELNFLQVYDIVMQQSIIPANSLPFRRLASFTSSNHFFPRLRTLHCFWVEGNRSVDATLLPKSKFKLLRVLDFTDFIFEGGKFSDAIGDQIHLRYLGLRGTGITVIPPSIGNLLALQTLDAFTPGVSLHLDCKIWDLKQLRHLYGWQIRCSFPINKPTSLQTLATVAVDGQMEFDSNSLINLRELQLFCRGSGFTLDCIGKLGNLRNLDLDFQHPSCCALQPLSDCKNLCQLRLIEYTGKLPMEMHEILPNLKYLHLRACGMNEDPMPALEKLPMLTVLEIGGLREPEEWACTAGGFPDLKVLQIFDCDVKELRVEGGGMRLLECFRFEDSDCKIPERIKSLPAPEFSFPVVGVDGCLRAWVYY